jgi:hypothetical protein
MASRLRVEELLLEAVPDSVALRASIVIGAKSRSFRFLVRLVERVPCCRCRPWVRNSTQPIDGRDMLSSGRAAAPGGGRSSVGHRGLERPALRDLIERGPLYSADASTARRCSALRST